MVIVIEEGNFNKNSINSKVEVSRCKFCGPLVIITEQIILQICPSQFENNFWLHILMMFLMFLPFLKTFNMALLDSGCTKTVCGERWP